MARPTASLHANVEGFELWISGLPLTDGYVQAANRFFSAWFGEAWPSEVTFSRHPIQALPAGSTVDAPLTVALRAGDGLRFLSLLANSFTSVCACLDVAGARAHIPLQVTHELESPAFRIQLLGEGLPAEGELAFILSALEKAGISVASVEGPA